MLGSRGTTAGSKEESSSLKVLAALSQKPFQCMKRFQNYLKNF
jgi:hypothetical protein